MPLKPRDLIVDNWGREGIVAKRARKPSASWLSGQLDDKMRQLPKDTIWWEVLNFRGGAVIVPEPLAQFVREATIEDAMRAAQCANQPALDILKRLFPKF